LISMSIPYEVLVSWSKPGKNEVSKQTYGILSDIITKNVDVSKIRLQGSYGNSTNVKDNSDIDILAMCRGFSIDNSRMYPIRDLKYHVYRSINGKEGYIFSIGSKTIKYRGGTNRVPADIVPCVECRVGREEAIALYDEKRNKIIYNYPMQHIENGESKSGFTDGNFKKAVRMFKNARNKLVDMGRIQESVAPSYFVECYVYNAPNDLFKGNEEDVFFKVISWMCNDQNTYLKCQNGIDYLYGTDSTQWSVANKTIFLNGLIDLWNKWR